MGTLCKCKKVTYVGHVGHAVDAVRSGHSTQWTQYAVDAVCSGCSTQWMQYAVDAVCSAHSTQWNSGIWWLGHCLWCKKVKPVDAVE